MQPFTIGFNQARYRESEGAGAVAITVQLLPGTLERTVTIRMYTMDGVATGPLMYKMYGNTVLFPFSNLFHLHVATYLLVLLQQQSDQY